MDDSIKTEFEAAVAIGKRYVSVAMKGTLGDLDDFINAAASMNWFLVTSCCSEHVVLTFKYEAP